MPKKNYNIIHKRSSVKDNAPTPTTLEYGEIAVNYNANNEKLFVRNSTNTIALFPSQTLITEQIEEEKNSRIAADDVLTANYTALETRVRNLESALLAQGQ